ncbi:MAG: hypothetical protein LBV27_08235 [Oscillospiraceae bacterium]|jgi:hypothetical protein|nr:hypothetical protein [Oscillospiraceae bacterium]
MMSIDSAVKRNREVYEGIGDKGIVLPAYAPAPRTGRGDAPAPALKSGPPATATAVAESVREAGSAPPSYTLAPSRKSKPAGDNVVVKSIVYPEPDAAGTPVIHSVESTVTEAYEARFYAQDMEAI